MQIAVTTPTGNIGHAVAQGLLDRGEKPVIIARDAAKVKALTDRGAVLKQGTHADAAFLVKATEGVQALFLLTPPDFRTEDIRATYRRFGEAAVEAVRVNKIPYVVHLSSVGADLERGNGPVAGLYVNEQLLNQSGAHVLHLRPGYFMENTLGQIQSIAQHNAMFTTFPQGTRFAMIATQDIGAAAVEYLLRRDWSGKKVAELQGPGETSYDEVAGVLSEVLGRKVNHVTVKPEDQVAALTQMGLSKTLAKSFHELTIGLVERRVKFHETRGPSNTTKTTYPVFAKDVFRPAFNAATNK
jgi:uncharacterized protein YbjT (DUF2867 family)